MSLLCSSLSANKIHLNVKMANNFCIQWKAFPINVHHAKICENSRSIAEESLSVQLLMRNSITIYSTFCSIIRRTCTKTTNEHEVECNRVACVALFCIVNKRRKKRIVTLWHSVEKMTHSRAQQTRAQAKKAPNSTNKWNKIKRKNDKERNRFSSSSSNNKN